MSLRNVDHQSGQWLARRIRNLPADTQGRLVLNDSRYLPPAARAVAQASLDQYQVCREEDRVDWTYMSPPASLQAGERTGDYRRGNDELLLVESGESSISMEDLAVALIDEIEQPTQHQRRITVAY